MTAPVITIRRFFSTTQIVAHEDFLAVLDSGFGQDRLRRVHYADISRVVYGTAPTVGFAVLYVALSVIGMLSIAVWSQPVFGVLVLAPCGFMAALAILRGKTVFVFESGGRECHWGA